MPRAFWRFVAATGVSNVSDGLVSVVLPLMALQLTGSAVAVAAVAAATRLPWLLFALLAGAVIDRVDRRVLMVRAQLLRGAGLVVLATAVAFDLGSVPALVVMALLLGTAEVLYDSAAQTMLPSVVPRDSLPAANSRLFGVEATANTFVGPPLGGLLVFLTAPIAILTGSVGYLVAAGLMRSLPGTYRPGADANGGEPPGTGHPDPPAAREHRVRRILAEVREGVRYLFADRVLRRLTLLVAVSSFTMAAIGVVLPVHVVTPGPIGLTEAGYGVLVASSGIGAVLASLTSERVVRRVGATWCLRGAIVAVALMQCLLLSDRPVVVGAALATMSFFVVVWNVVTVSYRQAAVPDHLLGRVNSAYRTCAWGAGPLGAVAGGVLAGATSTATAFVVAGLCTAAMVPVVWRIRDVELVRGA